MLEERGYCNVARPKRQGRKLVVPEPFIRQIDNLQMEINRRMMEKGAKKVFTRQDVMQRLSNEIKNDTQVKERVVKIQTRGKKAFKL